MYFETLLEHECSGCGACSAVCPKDAIQMIEKGGFIYPEIDESKCIKCSLCGRVCSNMGKKRTDTETPFESACYYGWINDRAKRLNSTSGGAFRAIAEAWMKAHPGAWVYGAVYDSELRVIHRGVNAGDAIEDMCRSKYFQSDLTRVYAEIKERIRNKEYVLFSGTPCQVAALNAVVGCRSPYLLTMDFVCHGVMSPVMFSYYIRELQKKKHRKIVSYSFRNKVSKPWKKSLRLVKIGYADGHSELTDQDLLVIAYKKHLFYRESCYHCPYASMERAADITVGDFWGIEKKIPSLKKERIAGISMILFNREQGMAIKSILDGYMTLKKVPAEMIVYGQMEKPTEKPQAEYDASAFGSDVFQTMEKIIPSSARFAYAHPKFSRWIRLSKGIVRKAAGLLKQ